MCGIAGFISLQHTIQPKQLQAATSLMHHRGPDADGFFFSEDGSVGLAHRRLSIIDLSATANQPMFSADGRYCIVYNGEVYNFSSLKQQLPNGGIHLKTHGDTEVILELFVHLGPDCFALLNGMFALAIYDLQEGVLTLARDHIGIKPLFVYQDSDTLVFGSELKVIRSMMRDKLSINKSAIPYFLHLGFIPEPLTIYNHTQKFPAASYVQINVKTNPILPFEKDIRRFWQLKDTISNTVLKDEQLALPELKALLQDAVEQQLVSDVPIGTFLSGGIDSSLVTAMAARISGANRINSFSMAIADGQYNESGYAQQVAKHLQVHHHEFRVTEREVAELVQQLLPAYDEPFGDTSAFPTMMVSRLARQEVTVALSGDGGDELFQGYGMYRWAERLQQPILQSLRKPIHAVSQWGNSRTRRAGGLFGYPNKQHLRTHIFSQEQYGFSEQELKGLLIKMPFDFDTINELPSTDRILNPREQQAFWDVEHYLKDDLLVKVDRASMQFSLETRVPLLDHRLVTWAFNLDTQLKVKGPITKYLLKEVLYEMVPKAIFDRPKWGFSIPLVRWLKTEFRPLLETYTDPAMIEKHGVVNNAVVQKMKRKYLSGMDYLYHRLWLILVLHWWLDTYPTAQDAQDPVHFV